MVKCSSFQLCSARVNYSRLQREDKKSKRQIHELYILATYWFQLSTDKNKRTHRVLEEKQKSVHQST